MSESLLWQGAKLNRTELIKEIGDVRWYLETLCIALDLSIADIEETNVKKLRARYPNGFTPNGAGC